MTLIQLIQPHKVTNIPFLDFNRIQKLIDECNIGEFKPGCGVKIYINGKLFRTYGEPDESKTNNSIY